MAPTDPAPAPAPGQSPAVNIRDFRSAWMLICPAPPATRPELVTTREEDPHHAR